MNEENAQVIYDLLDRIKVTDENRERMEKIRKFLSESKFQEALDELQILQMSGNVEYEDYAEVKEKERKIKENTGNMLKQALERRQTEQLSSNFSYRMMERIHLEAEKQTKRKTSIGWVALLVSVLALVGLGIYVLTFYLDFSFAGIMPKMNLRQDSSLFAFYVYIALLALVLLALDYWLHKKYIWK